MSLIKDTWRQIVHRRLWPIALVLLGGLVAVPMLLSKQPEAPAPVPPAHTTAGAGDDLATKPVVALATPDDRRRHVLGDSKDPFKPDVVAKAAKAGGAATASKTKTTKTTSTGGSTGTGGSSTPSPAAPAPAAKRTYPAGSLTVRFGIDGDTKSVLEVGSALPEATDDTATPVLVYLGLTKSGKQARFLLDAGVNADGDGRCISGGGTACETLYLSAGETEFLDVTGDDGTVTAKYQLDVVAIHRSAKAAKAAAKAAKAAKTAAASAHVSRVGAATAGPTAVGLAGVARLLGHL